MRFMVGLGAGIVLAASLASSAAATPKAPVRKPMVPHPVSAAYEGTGKVILHKGQPCTSQIMFDFRPNKSKTTVFLAAHVRESNTLTDAARRHRSVTVAGTWQHGREKTCRFVNVSSVAVLKGFFSW